MEQNGAEKKNIAVTKPDMSLLSTSQLPMSSFGLLSMSFAQDIIDRDTVETSPVPMFSLDYLEEENTERTQEVVVSPVLNLDFRFLMQQMERLEGIKKDIHEEVKFIREGDVYRLSPVSHEKRTQLHIKNITQRCADLQEKRQKRLIEAPKVKMVSSIPEEHRDTTEQAFAKHQNPFLKEAVTLDDLYGQERTYGGERSVDPQLIIDRINELATKQKQQEDSFREKLDNPDYTERIPDKKSGKRKKTQKPQTKQEVSGSVGASVSEKALPEAAKDEIISDRSVRETVIKDRIVSESVERNIREAIEKQIRNSVSQDYHETEIRNLTESIEKKYFETAETVNEPELGEFIRKELETRNIQNVDHIREKQELRRIYLPEKKENVSRRPIGAWKPAGTKYKDGITTAQAEMLFSNVIQAEQQLGLTYGMQDGAELGSPMDRTAYLKETTKQIRRKEQLAEDLMSVPAGILPEEELFFLEELTQQTGVSDRLLSVAEAEIRRALELKNVRERNGSAAAENVRKTTEIDAEAAGTAAESKENAVNAGRKSSSVDTPVFSGIEIRTETAEKSSKSEERTEKDRIIRKTILLNRIRMSLLSGESENAERLLEQFGREAAIQEQQELNYLPLITEQNTMKLAANLEASNKSIADKTFSDNGFSEKKPSERESTGIGAASTQTVSAETVNTKTINTESINTKTVEKDTEKTNTEKAYTEKTNTEKTNTEKTDTKKTDTEKTEQLNKGGRTLTLTGQETVSYLRENDLIESVRFLLQEGKEQEAERLIFQYEKKTGIDTEKLDQSVEPEVSESIPGHSVITASFMDTVSAYRQAAEEQRAEFVYPEMEEFTYLEENTDQQIFGRLERAVNAGESAKALDIINKYIRFTEQAVRADSNEKENRKASQPLRLQGQKEQQEAPKDQKNQKLSDRQYPEEQKLSDRQYQEMQTTQLFLNGLRTSLDDADFQKAGTLLLDYEKQSMGFVLSDKQAVKSSVKKNKKSAGTGEAKNVNLPERVDELEYLEDRQEGPEAGWAGKTVQQSTEAGMQPAESRIQQAKDQIQPAEGRMSFRKEKLERISVLVREKNADEARKLVAELESELKAFYSAEAVQKAQGSAEERTAIPAAQGSAEERSVIPQLQQSSDERSVIRKVGSEKDGTPAVFPEYYRETDLEYLEEEKADGATKAGEAVQKLQIRPESRSSESRSPESRSPEEKSDTVSARIELVRQLQTYLRNGQVAKAQKLITRYRDIIGRQEFGTPQGVPEKGMLENVDLGYLETAEKAADGQLMPGVKSDKSAAQTPAPKEGRTGRPVIRREAGQPWQVPGFQEIKNAPTHETGRFDEHPLDISYVTVPSENTGQQSAGSREPGKPAEKTFVPNGQAQSEYYKSLPEWTRKFFETGFQENGGTASKENETSGGAAGSGSIPAGRNITWSNPAYPNAVAQAAPMQEIVLKKKEEQPPQVHISEREIRRTAEKVYKILEERLRNERRRHGF